MQKLPCPRCGSTKTLGTFCKDCLQELYPLVKETKQGKLTLCSHCERVMLLGKWKNIPLDDALVQALSPGLKFSSTAKIKSVEFSSPELEKKPGIKRKTTVLAIVTGRHEDANTDYEEEYETPLQYDVTICPTCRKQGTEYYEGILQIRNETPRIKQEIKKYLKAHATKGLLVTKTIPTPKGTDYYLTDHRAVGHLAKKLHKEYGGELKINAQHFSEDTRAGKILYRTNALLALPEYEKGDIIKRDDEYLIVLGITTKVKAENLLTGKQEIFPYVRDDARKLPSVKTTIASIRPFAVLHPETYQAVQPENIDFIPDIYERGDAVHVVVDAGHIFILPGSFL